VASQRLRGVGVRVKQTMAGTADVEMRADFVYNQRDKIMRLQGVERQWPAGSVC
jgi:hypothetical protein